MNAPASPTGADLGRRLRQAAHAAGVSLGMYLRPLTLSGSGWVNNLEQVQRPGPATIARVEALLAGLPVPPPARARAESAPRYHGLGADGGPRVDPSALTYSAGEPCFFCGVRADVGCKHRRAE